MEFMDATSGILIVEDDPDFIGPLVELTLAALPGAEVESVSTAREALERIEKREGAYSLVLSDMILPGEISGIQFWELCRRRFPDLPFCFMSGMALAMFRTKLPEEGKRPSFLAKPFSPAEFRLFLDMALWKG